jgi:hypothetical protein
VTPASGTTALTEGEEAVLRQVTSLNTSVFAATLGLLGAAVVSVATVVQLLRDDPAGAGLHLLSVFFWGYRVSGIGILVGAFWGFLYGAILGALVYRGYARTLRGRLAYLAPGVDRRKAFRVPVIRLHGTGLGWAIGLIAALQLLVMTNWLVVRGTEAASAAAMLLAQYLPGYSISPLGSLVGAAQLFAVAFLAALALAGLYNRIVDWRQSQIPRRR